MNDIVWLMIRIRISKLNFAIRVIFSSVHAYLSEGLSVRPSVCNAYVSNTRKHVILAYDVEGKSRGREGERRV